MDSLRICLFYVFKNKTQMLWASHFAIRVIIRPCFIKWNLFNSSLNATWSIIALSIRICSKPSHLLDPHIVRVCISIESNAFYVCMQSSHLAIIQGGCMLVLQQPDTKYQYQHQQITINILHHNVFGASQQNISLL